MYPVVCTVLLSLASVCLGLIWLVNNNTAGRCGYLSAVCAVKVYNATGYKYQLVVTAPRRAGYAGVSVYIIKMPAAEYMQQFIVRVGYTYSVSHIYVCSEWDFGGMPYWLQSKPGISVRTCDEEFLKYAKRYYTRLAEEFLPYLSTKGGPIIAIAVENEYGSFGDDNDYIKWTGDLMKELGVDVPLFTANGYEKFKMQYGTSYDVDAPITEHGEPTEKYYLCKKVLKEYVESIGFEFTGTDEFEKTEPKVPTQALGEITLTQSADLLSQAKELGTKCVKSGKPLTMDILDQDYGYILYTTYVKYTDDTQRALVINGLHDRALIFGNGEYLGCYMRDREYELAKFYVPKEGMRIDILVENMGRINYGLALHTDKKGICGYVKIELVLDDGSIYPHNYGTKTGFENTCLPMKDPSKANFDNGSVVGRPAIFAGSFDAKPGVDTFVNTQKLHKGNVWINGFNLGRYWEIGPQGSLYVPGELLKERNTIHVLELHNTENVCKVTFEDKPNLDTIDRDIFFSSQISSGKCLQKN